jgi:hypothetical protein
MSKVGSAVNRVISLLVVAGLEAVYVSSLKPDLAYITDNVIVKWEV